MTAAAPTGGQPYHPPRKLTAVAPVPAKGPPGSDPEPPGADRPALATVASVLAEARYEIHAAFAGGWQAGVLAQAADRLAGGVEVRVLLSDAARALPDWDALAGRVAAGGGEVRATPLVPAGILLVDRSIAVFSLAEAGRTDTLVTRDRLALRLLDAQFRHEWQLGVPYTPARERAESGPDDLDLALLDVLASGAKDETAARLLGMSVRSVRRRVAELGTRLGAGSRFEIGVRAAERGWVTSRTPSGL